MRVSKIIGVIICGLLLAAAPRTSLGHFVWLGVEKNDAGQDQAQVWFGETAAPGEGELIEKISKTQVWAIAEDGSQRKLKTQVQVDGDDGALVADLKKPIARLAATIEYGVIERGGQPFLLKYYARHITNTPQGLAKVSREQRLPVDVDAQLQKGKLQLTVLVDGKPRPGVELVVHLPRGKETEAETDELGRATVDASEPGVYAIRARVVEDKNGQFEGDKYAEIRHYSTLSLRVPRDGDSSDGVSLLKAARENRAKWENFPGFQAQATIYADGKRQEGTITVDADGDIDLDGFANQPDSVLRTLRSLVSHRMPGDADEGPVSLIDENVAHPLGQLIKLDYDTAMGSTYRIRDDVIRQVNREMGGGKFTISVLDVHRNQEAKYLPAIYTVTFWNKDGSVRTATTVRDQWQRVGRYDLPSRHEMVSTGHDKLDYTVIELRDHLLMSVE